MNQNTQSLTHLTQMPPEQAAEKFAVLRHEDAPTTNTILGWLGTFISHSNTLLEEEKHSLHYTRSLRLNQPERLLGASLQAWYGQIETLREEEKRSLQRTLEVWKLSQTETAELFGVSRQALHKWLQNGPPAGRVAEVADLAAATDLLVHYLKPDRVSAVVRRSIPALGGESLLDLFGRGETGAVLRACRQMFDFHEAHG